MNGGVRVLLLGFSAWFLVESGLCAEDADRAGSISLLDAVHKMLEFDPNLEIAESLVTTGEGLESIAAGRFDPVLSGTADSSNSRTPTDSGLVSRTDGVNVSVGVDVETRLGTELSSSASIERTDAAGSSAIDRGSVSFTVRQPLLRGRGRRVTTSEESAVRFESDAAEYDLHHIAAQRVRAIAIGYWQLKAAIENAQILRQSEDSSRELLDTTRQLIEADRLPRAELVLLEANLALKETARIQGDRAVFDARRELGREIGFGLEKARLLPEPSDPFPLASFDGNYASEATDELASLAYRRRSDLAALELRTSAAETRLLAAENDLLPQLDLFLTPSYVGRSNSGSFDGFFSSLFEDVPGLSTTLSVGFAWPLRNRAAEGRLLLAEEVKSRSQAASRLLRNDLDANLAIALDDLVSSIQELERAQSSADLFGQAARNEETKLRAGASTLIDVINQQDRFTLSQQSVVSAQRRLAVALIDLRFETGSLLDGIAPSLTVSAESLVTVPEAIWPSR